MRNTLGTMFRAYLHNGTGIIGAIKVILRFFRLRFQLQWNGAEEKCFGSNDAPKCERIDVNISEAAK